MTAELEDPTLSPWASFVNHPKVPIITYPLTLI